MSKTKAEAFKNVKSKKKLSPLYIHTCCYLPETNLVQPDILHLADSLIRIFHYHTYSSTSFVHLRRNWPTQVLKRVFLFSKLFGNRYFELFIIFYSKCLALLHVRMCERERDWKRERERERERENEKTSFISKLRSRNDLRQARGEILRSI